MQRGRMRFFKAGTRLKGLAVPTQLVLALAGLIIVGGLLLKLPGMTVQPISWVDSFFTAASASTVTGLVVFNTATTFTFPGQVVILFLVQLGGAGLIVMWVYLIYMLRRRITHQSRLAVIRSLGFERNASVPQLLGRTVRWMLMMEGLGALALFVRWWIGGLAPDGRTAFYAIFHSITAFCNAGFDLFTGLPQYPQGFPSDPLTLVILAALIIIGGLGVPVYLDVMQYRRSGRPLRLNTLVTLRAALVLVLLGWAALLFSEYWQGGVLSGATFVDRFFRAGFQSVSARTAGFASLTNFASLHPDSRMIMIALMFIGSGPASMGGGITTGTFVVLMAAVVSYTRGLPRVNMGHKTIPTSFVRRAVVVFVAGITLTMTATWLLLLTHPFALDEALFEVVSAFSTTGLSLDVTPQLNNFGKLLIMLVMFWGRLGATTIMASLLGEHQESELVEFPEEQVLVG